MTHSVPQGAALDAAYATCRDLHRTHGRSYYLATRLLPPWKRRHVHALYGFTRYTDDIVDAGGGALTRPGDRDRERELRLDTWAAQFYAALDGGDDPVDPVLRAVRHTIAVFGIPRSDFDAFLASMRMDLRVRAYADYAALLRYMEGSAAVIGTMMLPILLAPDDGRGPVPAAMTAAAREPARQLGLAFQLTNFIRDVAEDLGRGRVYLPGADLDRFGVHKYELAAPSASPAVRRLIAFEIERARAHYRDAQPGLAMLPPRSRRCVRVAHAVYGGILDRVEQAGCDVLAARAVVPRSQRAVVVARELARSA
jgi:phytoene synthase